MRWDIHGVETTRVADTMARLCGNSKVTIKWGEFIQKWQEKHKTPVYRYGDPLDMSVATATNPEVAKEALRMTANVTSEQAARIFSLAETATAKRDSTFTKQASTLNGFARYLVHTEVPLPISPWGVAQYVKLIIAIGQVSAYHSFCCIINELQNLRLLSDEQLLYNAVGTMKLVNKHHKAHQAKPLLDFSLEDKFSTFDVSVVNLWAQLGVRWSSLDEIKQADVHRTTLSSGEMNKPIIQLKITKMKNPDAANTILMLACNCMSKAGRPGEIDRSFCFCCKGGRRLPNFQDINLSRVMEILKKLQLTLHSLRRTLILFFYFAFDGLRDPRIIVAVNRFMGWGDDSTMRTVYTRDADSYKPEQFLNLPLHSTIMVIRALMKEEELFRRFTGTTKAYTQKLTPYDFATIHDL
jgi:hypothetical protein